MERPPRPKRKPETRPVDEKHGPKLGRADHAGHPGERQNLDAKTDSEDEHA
jgi:hypothetical protein